MARRHMITHGTTTEQLAIVAATIRNNGHDNPDAVYFGKGPFSPADILASRMVADPFHLLDCAMTSEGGCGIVLASADRAAGPPPCDLDPRWRHRLLRARLHGRPCVGLQEPRGRGPRRRGRRARRRNRLPQRRALARTTWTSRSCTTRSRSRSSASSRSSDSASRGKAGHSWPTATSHTDGRLPVTTDGGTMSFSHAGIAAQQLQRVIRAVEQLRGTCASHQVDGRRGRHLLERRLGSPLHRRDASRVATPVSTLEPQPPGHPGPASPVGPVGAVLGRPRGAASSPTSGARPAVSSGCGLHRLRQCLGRESRARRRARAGSLYSWTVVWRPPDPAFWCPTLLRWWSSTKASS